LGRIGHRKTLAYWSPGRRSAGDPETSGADGISCVHVDARRLEDKRDCADPYCRVVNAERSDSRDCAYQRVDPRVEIIEQGSRAEL